MCLIFKDIENLLEALWGITQLDIISDKMCHRNLRKEITEKKIMETARPLSKFMTSVSVEKPDLTSLKERGDKQKGEGDNSSQKIVLGRNTSNFGLLLHAKSTREKTPFHGL